MIKKFYIKSVFVLALISCSLCGSRVYAQTNSPAKEVKPQPKAIPVMRTTTDDPNSIEPPPPGEVVKPAPAPPEIFTSVEQMPVPNKLEQYLRENLRYPSNALSKHITGRVIVKFVVRENGKVSDAQVVRSVGGGCDEEALRVVNNMPLWKPGMEHGKPVPVYMTLPISFALN